MVLAVVVVAGGALPSKTQVLVDDELAADRVAASSDGEGHYSSWRNR